jgi:hypothetical protein
MNSEGSQSAMKINRRSFIGGLVAAIAIAQAKVLSVVRPWSPLDLPGLTGWWDFTKAENMPDGNIIVRDLSGNGNHMVGPKSVLLDLPPFTDRPEKFLLYDNVLSDADRKKVHDYLLPTEKPDA